MNSAAPELKAANTDSQVLDRSSYTTEATVAELFAAYTITLLYMHFTSNDFSPNLNSLLDRLIHGAGD